MNKETKQKTLSKLLSLFIGLLGYKLANSYLQNPACRLVFQISYLIYQNTILFNFFRDLKVFAQPRVQKSVIATSQQELNNALLSTKRIKRSVEPMENSFSNLLHLERENFTSSFKVQNNSCKTNLSRSLQESSLKSSFSMDSKVTKELGSNSFALSASSFDSKELNVTQDVSLKSVGLFSVPKTVTLLLLRSLHKKTAKIFSLGNGKLNEARKTLKTYRAKYFGKNIENDWENALLNLLDDVFYPNPFSSTHFFKTVLTKKSADAEYTFVQKKEVYILNREGVKKVDKLLSHSMLSKKVDETAGICILRFALLEKGEKVYQETAVSQDTDGLCFYAVKRDREQFYYIFDEFENSLSLAAVVFELLRSYDKNFELVIQGMLNNY